MPSLARPSQMSPVTHWEGGGRGARGLLLISHFILYCDSSPRTPGAVEYWPLSFWQMGFQSSVKLREAQTAIFGGGGGGLLRGLPGE